MGVTLDRGLAGRGAQASAVRLTNGCSAAIVSGQGLVGHQ
jgi:hypothetical protein